MAVEASNRPMRDANPPRTLASGLPVGHLLTPPHLATALDFTTTDITTNPAGNPGLNAVEDKNAMQLGTDVLLGIHRGGEVPCREPASTQCAV